MNRNRKAATTALATAAEPCGDIGFHFLTETFAESAEPRNSFFIVIPLEAGLLLLGSLAFDPPGAARRPAPSPAPPVSDVPPATVVLQGTVGDKKAAIRELRQMADAESIVTLSMALADDDARVRMAAAQALGDLGDSNSINIISTALRDPDPEVRQRAAEILDELNDDELFHALYPPQ